MTDVYDPNWTSKAVKRHEKVVARYAKTVARQMNIKLSEAGVRHWRYDPLSQTLNQWKSDTPIVWTQEKV